MLIFVAFANVPLGNELLVEVAKRAEIKLYLPAYQLQDRNWRVGWLG